jgi:hypothetical protein
MPTRSRGSLMLTLLAFALMLGSGIWLAIPRLPEAVLESLVDVDLCNLEANRKKELNRLLAAILPENYRSQGPWTPERWSIWKTEEGFILFQGCDLFMIPGQSSAAVHFLDRLA